MGRPRTISKNIKDFPRGMRKVGANFYWRGTDAGTLEIASQLKAMGLPTQCGSTVIQARAWWIKHVEPRLNNVNPVDNVQGTVEELLRRYECDELPNIKRDTTLVSYTACLKVLRKTFGPRRYAKSDNEALQLTVLRSPDMTRYLKENAHRRNSANKEASLLGRVFRLAISDWGLTTFNPCESIQYHSQPAREMYIDDDQYLKMREAAHPVLQCIMDISVQTGARQGMILGIKMGDIAENQITLHVNKQKTQSGTKAADYVMTADLGQVIEKAIALRKKMIGGGALTADSHLFVTRNGKPYCKSSIKRLWKTMRDKTGFASREITFHDIRAKAASDSESDEAAQKLLVHTNTELTKRVYRRKTQMLNPIPGVKMQDKQATYSS